MYICINLLYILNPLTYTYTCKSHSSKKLGPKKCFDHPFLCMKLSYRENRLKLLENISHCYACMLSHFSHCISMDFSLPGSSVHEILQEEYLSGLPFPPPGYLPDPGIEPVSLISPTLSLSGRFFTTSITWEAPLHTYLIMSNSSTI